MDQCVCGVGVGGGGVVVRGETEVRILRTTELLN